MRPAISFFSPVYYFADIVQQGSGCNNMCKAFQYLTSLQSNDTIHQVHYTFA